MAIVINRHHEPEEISKAGRSAPRIVQREHDLKLRGMQVGRVTGGPKRLRPDQPDLEGQPQRFGLYKRRRVFNRLLHQQVRPGLGGTAARFVAIFRA